jgi:hypothetical protein
MGKDFKTTKVKTSLNKNVTLMITLPDFLQVIKALSKKQDVVAQQLVDDLLGLSLQQLFCDAFGEKFEKEERQAWLKARQNGKQVRRTLTDAIKEYIASHNNLSDHEVKFIYANVTDAINLGLFNRKASQLKEDWKCVNPREQMTDQEILLLSGIENLAMRLIDQDNLPPMIAVEEALNRLIIPTIAR